MPIKLVSATGQWNKLSDTTDLVSYERDNYNRGRVRIEARMLKGYWQIFKTYFNDREVIFTEEYTTETRPEALNIINVLKKERILSYQEIKQIKKLLSTRIVLSIERSYKEYEVEKWHFTINNDPTNNFATIRYCETINMDIILHEKYHYLEKRIMEELISKLGLKEFGLEINKNIYFFTKKAFFRSRPSRKGIVISKIEMDYRNPESGNPESE